jgi:hypothetical protein
MDMENMARWLLVASVVAILLGPVIIMMLAFSVDGLFIGGALLIMGALGLYAGMKSLNRPKADSQ